MVRPDASGKLHVTSAGTIVFSGIRHFVRTTSGWSAPISIPSPSATRWIWPDYAGGIHFYGAIYSSPGVLYSYWLDGQFRVDEQYIVGDLGSSDSQIDARNNLYLYRRDQVPVPGGTVYGIYQRCLTHELVLTGERVLSGQTDILSSMVAAEDGRSRVVLAWQESIGKVVQVRLFEDCNLIHSSSVTLPTENEWELKSAALSPDPNVVCLLARQKYSSQDWLVECARITE